MSEYFPDAGEIRLNQIHNGTRRKAFMKFDRITVDPNICMGQPTVRGTRITVAVILRMTASGMTPAEIVRDYPELSEDDVRHAAAYGAWLASEQSRTYI